VNVIVFSETDAVFNSEPVSIDAADPAFKAYEAVTAYEADKILFDPKGPYTLEDVTKEAVSAVTAPIAFKAVVAVVL
jgi:hypothetical protein